MKFFRIIILFAFILCGYEASAAEAEPTLRDLFPKSTELPGGSSSWIVSGVAEESRNECKLYTNTYTYYADNGSTLLGIDRNNTYMVSVRIFACGNFLNAIDIYNSLIKIEDKAGLQQKTAPVTFGERGVLMVVPVKKKTMMADFYLTFLFRTFVVQVYSDDGFAQMDMAGEIERRLKLYSIGKGGSYFINKINLKTTHEKLKEKNAQVSFTGDNISSVMISGTVYDGANRPVPKAEITVKETGQKTTTDEKGQYAIEVTSGEGKSVSLNKIIFMDGAISGEPQVLSSGLYPLAVTSDMGGSAQILDILVTGGKIIGKSYLDGKSGGYNITGTVDNTSLSFTQNCTAEGSAFRCLRKFQSEIIEGGVISGQWTGTGGGGSWSINKTKFAVVKDRPYLRDARIALSSVKLSSGVISGSSDDTLMADNAKDRSFLRLTISGSVSNPLFFKEGFINLSIIKNELKDNADIVLYGIVRDDKGVQVNKIAVLAKIKKGEIGSLPLNISSQMRQPAMSGYFIGIESGKGGRVYFTAEANGEFYYYRDAENYKPVETLSAKIISFDGVDVASNANAIKSDGEGDITLQVSVSAPARVLEYCEVIADGDSIRRWNTNPFDIYPAIAVSSGGVIINKYDGSINVELENNIEVFDFNIYRGTLDEQTMKKITVKVIIDGKVYESIIEK